MENSLPALIAAVGLTACGILLLMVDDWRVAISVLAVQYIGVFVLIELEWPLVMAVTRLVSGWMAAAVLGMGMLGLSPAERAAADSEARSTAGPPRLGRRLRRDRLLREAPGALFLLPAALLVCLTILAAVPSAVAWIPGLGTAHAWGGLILIGLGLLKLGVHAHPLHVTLGLLTVFAGFEILFAAVNAVALIAALTAAICLGIALAGAYLLLAPTMEAGE